MLCINCHQEERYPNSRYCSLCRSRRQAHSEGKTCPVCDVPISNKSTHCMGHSLEARTYRVENICSYPSCEKKFYTMRARKRPYCSLDCYRSNQDLIAQTAVHKEQFESRGYKLIRVYARGRRVRVHILKAEKALGRRLKKGEMVHHWDMNKGNNENSNLLICDTAYHRWLHYQMEVQWVKKVLIPSRKT